MPQNPASTFSVNQAASLSYNTNANNAGIQIATGRGVLASVATNTVGTTSSVTLYDGTSTSGKKLGTWSTVALAQALPNLQFITGLFGVFAGGAAADVTIGYRQPN